MTKQSKSHVAWWKKFVSKNPLAIDECGHLKTHAARVIVAPYIVELQKIDDALDANEAKMMDTDALDILSYNQRGSKFLRVLKEEFCDALEAAKTIAAYDPSALAECKAIEKAMHSLSRKAEDFRKKHSALDAKSMALGQQYAIAYNRFDKALRKAEKAEGYKRKAKDDARPIFGKTQRIGKVGGRR